MINFAVPFQILAPGSGGSKWYAPAGGSPTVLPVASGSDALAAGNAAVASGANSIAFGPGALASGEKNIAVGISALASFGLSCVIAIGDSASATNSGTISFGRLSTASGAGSNALGSFSNATKARGIALGFGAVSVNDDELARRSGTTGGRSLSLLRGADTTDATPTNTAVWTIPSDTGGAFTGKLVAYQTGGVMGTVGDTAMWTITGCVKNIGGVITLVGVAVGLGGFPNYNDAGSAAWTGAILVGGGDVWLQVTGEVDKEISWEAQIDIVTTY